MDNKGKDVAVEIQRNETSQSGHQILGHAAIYLLARGLPGILAFLAIPLFTRLLKPAEYGEYALVLATVTLINAFLFQGLRLSIVRFLPHPGTDRSQLKSTLVTAILISLGVLAVVAALGRVTPLVGQWSHLLWPLWTLLALMALFDTSSEYARAAIQPWRYMGLQSTRSAAVLIIGVPLVLLGAGWWGPLAGLAVGMALAVAYSYRTDWRGIRLKLNPKLLSKICRYGLPLSTTVALTSVINSSDRFLIAALLGTGSVGLYSVGADLATQTVGVLMNTVYLAVFPLAVRAWEQDGPAAAVAQMQHNSSLLLALGMPCVVGMAVLAPGISNCLLGSSFRQSATVVVPLIAVGAFIAGLKNCHFDAALQFAHHTMDQVYIVLIAAVANIAINVVAIKIAGINGAAVASGLAYILALVLTIWWGRRYVALSFPLGAAAKTVLASGTMAAMLLPFRDHKTPLALVTQVAAGATLYGSLLLAFDFLGLRSALLQKLGSTRQRPEESVPDPAVVEKAEEMSC
jgi:O-antigen/teichoic acid export membrane protein